MFNITNVSAVEHFFLKLACTACGNGARLVTAVAFIIFGQVFLAKRLAQDFFLSILFGKARVVHWSLKCLFSSLLKKDFGGYCWVAGFGFLDRWV